jgi:RHS repeat-associated protein
MAEADNELTWAAEEEAPEVSPLSDLIGNPYMFTGRRFDLETGLYYYRARYYNPQIGRFLQTDPIGYSDGINWYNYCSNNPVNGTDPSGQSVDDQSLDWTWYGLFQFLELDDKTTKLTFQYWGANGQLTTKSFDNRTKWKSWAEDYFEEEINRRKIARKSTVMAGQLLASGDSDLFWELQLMAFLCRDVGSMLAGIDDRIETTGHQVNIVRIADDGSDSYDYGSNTLRWNAKRRGWIDYFPDTDRRWHSAPAMVGLAHELRHCLEDLDGLPYHKIASEDKAIRMENKLRYKLFQRDPSCKNIFPRPGLLENLEDIDDNAEDAWRIFNRSSIYPIMPEPETKDY